MADKQNITAQDASLVAQYQTAMLAGDIQRANAILVTIPNYAQKIINADFLNSLIDDVRNLQTTIREAYNPSITVSTSAPTTPQVNDYWWEVI